MRVLRSIATVGAMCSLALDVGPARAAEVDPPWSVDEELLAAGLDCPATFAHPEREPVLLVHGTATSGAEQFGWNYALLLPERGFDVCTVTYPDRGLGDLQESAEYVAYALIEMHERTGRLVDVMGHSQGGLLPRWAIKFWPSARVAVDDAVLVAPPSHGTSVAGGAQDSPIPMPAAFFQMAPDSRFIAALNAGDETPGDVSWSVLYTDQDEMVQPTAPVPTAALDWGATPPSVRNVRIQAVCPGRVVDHLTIGTTDRLSQELVQDAFAGPGPVDPVRLGPPAPLCLLPDQQVDPSQLAVLLAQMPVSFSQGFPDMHEVSAEPPLKPYATASPEPAPGSTGTPAAPPTAGRAPSAAALGPAAARPAARLPATGSSIPAVPAAVGALASLAALRALRRAGPTAR